MIQTGSVLSICDNSGAKFAKCIRILKGSKTRYGKIGDKVVLTIKMLRAKRRAQSKVQKGKIFYGLIVHTKQDVVSLHGISQKFLINSAILLNQQNKPIGSRILLGLPRKIRYSKYMRLTAISAGILK